jgi:hypothetical protein
MQERINILQNIMVFGALEVRSSVLIVMTDILLGNKACSSR